MLRCVQKLVLNLKGAKTYIKKKKRCKDISYLNKKKKGKKAEKGIPINHGIAEISGDYTCFPSFKHAFNGSNFD